MHPTTEPGRTGRVATTALLAFALVAALLFVSCAGDGGEESAPAAGAARSASPDEVLARMEGETVTREEVEEAAAEELEQVETQLQQCQLQAQQRRHEIVETQTRQVVRERLLRAEAEERGMSEDQLLQAEVHSQIAPVTPEDVDAFYAQNQARIRQPKEQVVPQIEQYLRQQRETEAYETFISSLEEASQVAYEIGPYRAEIEVADAPSTGPADAPVTIVEFSDFQCPFCSRVVPTLEQVKEEYGDQVRLVFKQFPLRNIHPQAQKAAEASLCAQDQGRFWEMHDAMFADQDGLEIPGLQAKAESLGLDTAAFNECLESGRYADQVQADLEEGGRAGVTGTPAMFINGRMVSGAVPFEQVAQLVDEELEGRGAGS